MNQDKLGKMGRRVQVRERVIFSGNKIAQGQASEIRSILLRCQSRLIKSNLSVPPPQSPTQHRNFLRNLKTCIT